MANKEECSFCRNAIGQWHSELLMTDIGSDDIDDGFDYIRADVNITKHKTMVLQLTTDAGDEDIDEIDINFCPICGRDLRKEKEIKRLKEKLNSLYDPKMMTFTKNDHVEKNIRRI